MIVVNWRPLATELCSVNQRKDDEAKHEAPAQVKCSRPEKRTFDDRDFDSGESPIRIRQARTIHRSQSLSVLLVSSAKPVSHWLACDNQQQIRCCEYEEKGV